MKINLQLLILIWTTQLRLIALHFSDVLVDAVNRLWIALDEGEGNHGNDEDEPDDDVVDHQFPRRRSVARYDETRQQQTGTHENDADATYRPMRKLWEWNQIHHWYYIFFFNYFLVYSRAGRPNSWQNGLR